MSASAISAAAFSINGATDKGKLKDGENTTVQKGPLPVTLLSGFLGSGKTTLLEHILRSNDHRLRIAVVVNDMSSLNIDATLITNHKLTQTKESLIQLQNGCICCTLRGDLLEELANLAKSGEFQYVIIESTGISEPMQVAETFTQEFSKAMLEEGNEKIEQSEVLKEIVEMGGLHKFAQLDTTVTVIDAFNLYSNFSTADFISDRWGAIHEITPDDERTITDLLVDQIEFADVIIINKIETVGKEMLNRIKALITKLNPVAKVLTSSYSKVDVSEIVNTKKFSFEKAATGAGWLRSLHEMTMRDGFGKAGSGAKLAPKPETEEYGISSFVYTARKPFHPKRLYELLHDRFIILEGIPGEDDDDSDDADDSDDSNNSDEGDDEGDDEMRDSEDWETVSDGKNDTEMTEACDLSRGVDTKLIIENKTSHPIFKGLLRSKGFFWLATRPVVHGEWSQAGGMLTLQGGSPWFCMLGKDFWPQDPEIVSAIKADFQGPWGDRRQEIVFIGEKIDKEGLKAIFDECLLTEMEYKRWTKVMEKGVSKAGKFDVVSTMEGLNRLFEDGWEDWPVPEGYEEEIGVEVPDRHNNHNHTHIHKHATKSTKMASPKLK